MKLPALPVHDPLATMNFERLGASVEPLEVTALPGSPRDGQVIDYVADATAGVVWRLRYRAASASAYKWEFVGGSPRFAYVSGLATITTSATTFTSTAMTGGPTLTAPLSGEYDVRYSVSAALTTAAAVADIRIYSAVGGVNAGSTGSSCGIFTQYAYATWKGSYRVTATSGQTVDLRVASSAASVGLSVADASLDITPVRVG